MSSDSEDNARPKIMSTEEIPTKAGSSSEHSATTDYDRDNPFLKDGQTSSPPCVPLRYLIVGLTCIGMILVNAMRTNVGFTVMTILDERAHEKVGTLQALMNLPNVKWDTRMIGFLHSVFYVGYLITHLPGGYLATKMPCHRLYGGCILLSSALNLLLPVSIDDISYEFTCVVRLLQGLSEGLLYPSCYGILRHWSTPQERGRLGSLVLTGAYAGAVIGFPLAGFITHYIGWQYIYYVNGGAGVLWMLVWVLVSSEKPSHHSFISDFELHHLDKTQGKHVVDFEETWLPWKRIFTSPAVISLCFCHFARNWVFILMLTNEPFYLSLFKLNIAEITHRRSTHTAFPALERFGKIVLARISSWTTDGKDSWEFWKERSFQTLPELERRYVCPNGVYSSLPHVAKVILAFLSGFFADFLLLRYNLHTGTVRKLITGTAFGFQALGFFVLTFMVDKVPVIIFLTIGVGFGGFAVSGWQINHYDLSTRHASFLVAVSSTVGVLGAILAPIVAGHLTVHQDLQGWRHVFYITVAVVAVPLITFLLFGSGDEQPWATPPEHIQLIQKSDPLAKRPYKTFTVQGSRRPVPVVATVEAEEADESVGDVAENTDKSALSKKEKTT